MVNQVPAEFTDTFVIYPSEQEEGFWVAHSLNTDQIGTGQCVLDAYVALLRAMRILLEEAAKNPNLRLLTPAPKEVRDRCKHARRLPMEIIEIASMVLDGKQPAETPPPPYGGRFRNLAASVDLAELAV